MGTYRWGAGALAMWLGATGSVSLAKPPDLPAKADVRCEDGGEQAAPRRTSRPASADDEPAPVCIDVWCQSVLPLLFQQWCQQVQPLQRDASTAGVVRLRQAVPLGFGAENSPTAVQARLLYEQASRCARQGKLTEARARLREAHLANPTCRFGQLAIQRLQELEANTSVEEPSEPAPPAKRSRPQSNLDQSPAGAERTFQRMRQATQPLGLVLGATY